MLTLLLMKKLHQVHLMTVIWKKNSKLDLFVDLLLFFVHCVLDLIAKKI